MTSTFQHHFEQAVLIVAGEAFESVFFTLFEYRLNNLSFTFTTSDRPSGIYAPICLLKIYTKHSGGS